MKNFVFVLSIFCLFVGACKSEAAETSPVASSFPTQLSVAKQPADNQGTDTTNIYDLKVDFADAQYTNGTLYNIQLFVDNHPVEGFKQQALPFTVKRNFKGFMEGEHTIKINIEDNNNNILSSITSIIFVKHKK